MKDYLELGQIVNTRGLRGEVKVNPYTERMDRFEELDKIIVKTKNEQKEYEIEKVTYSKNQVILKLKTIDHIDYAEKLRGGMILVKKSDLEPLEEGVYYLADLIGLSVYDEENNLIGKVDDIYNTGANDIYVVKDDLGRQKLLPGIDEVIKQIDIENEKIIVHLIEGL